MARRRTALETKADKGDVNAARELRENHEYYYYGGAEQTIWELLTREQRAIVRGWLGEEPALPDIA